jgi:hypothetical protein
MARSSNWERARRINTALRLIRQYDCSAKVAEELVARFGVSPRQAYRYVGQAQALGEEVPIPGPKVPFTVKLPQDLVHRLRQYAKSEGKTLSEIVTRALESIIGEGQGHG